MEEQTPQEEKNKGGRPLKFKSVEELSQKIEAYFGNCDSHLSTRSIFVKRVDGTQYVEQEQYFTDREPYTVNGLAYALETTRDVLNDYESGMHDLKAEDVDESGATFSSTVKGAKRRIAADVERRLMKGETPAAAGIFWLKNNDGWRDRHDYDHTSGGKRFEAPAVYMSTIAPRDPEDAPAQTQTD
ncbi:DNA-packaging protein [Rhodococcus qingshengii]|uniref:terminase small subunit n=1 Tax=Rhodococcus TaxID=1827 RepID=UPI000F620A53|nr:MULTISPECIES: terminase small subunit [Rhodococcus]AZI61849.1 hypothetical protein EHW12_12225 [Rhodococcus sp. NJ-530]BDQ20057.1 DNA-packaging protein [Rhodococcus qingshengii]